MKTFLNKFIYLLDKSDQKNFVKFIGLLFMGGLLSLLGIGATIPFVNLLINPQQVKKLPLINHFTYFQAVSIIIFLLILAFWIKNIAAFFILKSQSSFLNRLVAKIQRRLFACYIHSSYEHHINRNSSELVSNITMEANMLSTQVVGQFGNLLNETVTSFLVLVTLLFISPIFTLAVASSVFLAARLFMQRLREKANYYGKLRAKNYARLAQAVVQGMGGIKETKIYQKENFFIDQVNSYSTAIAEAGAFSNVFGQSSRFLTEVIAITVVLSLMWLFIAIGHNAQEMLVLMSVFGVAAVQLLPSTNRLMQALSGIKYGYHALDKIYQEFKKYENRAVTEPALEDQKINEPMAFLKAIRLENIQFSYGHKCVLSDINLTISKGKRIALVGPSGAGKTTLVDIILGVLWPSQGDIFVDDQRITTHSIKGFQRHFGYIPQLIYIYDSTLRENIAFGEAPEQINDERVWECLHIASLSTFVKEQAEGLYTKVGENGIRLSGGQRQRIGIARALYHNPDILVMDEATAALDNQTEKEVTMALSKAGYGRTIITIAHRLSTIQSYDVIYVVDKGTILDFGNYEKLLDTSDKFSKMVKSTVI
jgi:ATP-binding cassette subfamily C protein